MSQFLTGALPSPQHVVYGAVPFLATAAPPSYIRAIPKRVDTWGNTQYGDCVSAEEAFAKIAYSTAAGVPDVFVSENDVIAWARKHGHLHGATLTAVLDDMRRDGMPANGRTWTDGSYRSVDWSDWATLTAAIVTGPVKLGIGSSPLQRVVTPGRNGWFLDSGRDRSLDHCVGVSAYGTAGELFNALGATPPSGVNLNAPSLLMHTWGAMGVITHQALMNITGEAWVRTPTTPEHRAPSSDDDLPGPPPPGPLPVPGGQILIDPINRTIHAPDGWRLV